MSRDIATPEQIKRARDEYGSDDIMIDDDAGQSPTETGVWVQAWVWLENPEDQAGGAK